MKGQPEVIKALNDILSHELTAVNLYLLHARMSHDWGYLKLATHHAEESQEEYTHASKIIERILFLEGTPQMTPGGSIKAGANCVEQLELQLDFENNAASEMRKGIDLCLKKQDNVTQNLLESILADSEKQIDFLKQQLNVVKEIGKQNYLSQKI